MMPLPLSKELGSAACDQGQTPCAVAMDFIAVKNKNLGLEAVNDTVRIMTTLDPDIYPRTHEQTPTFGIGVHILIGIDHDGCYTVFDKDGAKYFGPVAFGEFPEGHPPVEPRFLRVNHFADAEGEEREELWCRDLMMMAGHFHRQRLTAHLQDINLRGPSLAPLIGRIGKKDEHIVKSLGLWARRVELIEDVRGLGAMLPKGTVGLIGNGAYAYAMTGMCAYDVEVPVTELAPPRSEQDPRNWL